MAKKMANRAPRASRSRPTSSISAGTLCAALLVSGVAGAATPDRCQADRGCREQTEQAAQLAAQTRYEEALSRYMTAYERVPEPRLLVNIGRCHYRLGRARRALEYYEQFHKAEIDAEPELLARVGQFVAEAKLAIVSDSTTPVEKQPEPPPAPIALPPPPPPVAPPPVQPVPPSREPRPAWRIAAGASALGVGALFVGLGAGALSADGRCVTPDSMNPDLCAVMNYPDGSRTTMLIDSQATGIGLLVSGGLLVVGGAVLIALPGRRPKNLAFGRTADAYARGPGLFAFRVPAPAADGGAVR
jgi:hypothetical protein